MEYCSHIWVGAPSCDLELLVMLKKRIRGSFDPSFADCLQPLAHCRKKTSLSLFYRYCFGICLSELVPHYYFCRRSNRYFDFLLESLPMECLTLNYDLNGFNFRINTNLFHCRFFLKKFAASFCCNCMPFNGCFALNGVNLNYKKKTF